MARARTASHWQSNRAASVVAAFLAVLLSWHRSAEAAPQVSAAGLLGASVNGRNGDRWQSWAVAAALRTDLLLLRESEQSFGIGPFVEALTTTGFRDVRLWAGGSLLVPIHPFVPLVFSVGPWTRHSAGTWDSGIGASLFLGSRSYNYHSFYGLSAGLVLQAHRAFVDTGETSFVAALQVDLELIALPILVLVEALR